MKPWYRKFGWRKNPFSVKPNAEIVGLEKEKNNLINFIQGGNICFVTGDSGVGKTSLLRWTERSIKKHVPVYIDGESLTELFDLESYLKHHKRLWRDFFRRFPKNVVVLLDEAQESEDELKKTLRIYWESDYIKAVVITQIRDLENFSKAFRSRVGNRVIKIEKMPLEDIYEMLDKRVGRKNPFRDEVVEFIAKESNFIPRKILENFERTCIYLAKRGMKKKNISVSDIKGAY